MMGKQRSWQLTWTVGILWVVGAPYGVLAKAPTAEELCRQAEQAELRGEWVQACTLYEQLPARMRHAPELRKRYLACARQAQRVRRHRDASYHQQVAQLTLTNALLLYEDVLLKLQNGYVDRARAEIDKLFRHGLEELSAALDSPDFNRTYVNASAEATREYQAQLAQHPAAPRRPREAVQEAQVLAQGAEEFLGIAPVAVVLELTCGACAALDEYTSYLTPSHYSGLTSALKGEVVSVGVELVPAHQKQMIAQVLSGSPAQMAGLKVGDYVVRLAGQATHALTQEEVKELLAGALGTTLDLEVESRDGMEIRMYVLPRQLVRLPSVSAPRFLGSDGSGIGYVQVHVFHEQTLRELDEALRELHANGLRHLILDLRGNPGGAAAAAVDVARRFLPEGVIATTKGQAREANRKYEATYRQALTVPLVVLVDGGTASVAELVAGALKEHHRAALVGNTTFGKGILQSVRPLPSASAGLQLTVARFFTPGGRGYDGKGIVPDIQVDRTPPDSMMDLSLDLQLAAAVDAVQRR